MGEMIAISFLVGIFVGIMYQRAKIKDLVNEKQILEHKLEEHLKNYHNIADVLEEYGFMDNNIK
jgi:uncharacterized membrane-anchored protein YhcB (DUF1043 family)